MFPSLLLLGPAQESGISMEQSSVSKIMEMYHHSHHLTGSGKSLTQIFPSFKMNKTKLYLKESILIGIAVKANSHCQDILR